jgi:hypothetical protein
MPFLILWGNLSVYYLATVCLGNQAVTFLAIIDTDPIDGRVLDSNLVIMQTNLSLVANVTILESLVHAEFSNMQPRNCR